MRVELMPNRSGMQTAPAATRKGAPAGAETGVEEAGERLSAPLDIP